ncbi:hypothetical protein B586_19335 [Mycobacterium haemophilum DSM 44634]|nr:hypothetical protein B586_19335 [Mycobacterium haemophilum DSM 44634]MCV7342672.1 hypothetical protein [Mycobacterium haemophilum DSM 44634]
MVSQSSDDTPTGPIGRQADTVQTRQASPRPDQTSRQDVPAGTQHATGQPTQRWNRIRDLVAAILVVTALFLPWNLYFGVGIPASKVPLFGLLGAVTLLSLGSIAVTYVGPWRLSGARFKPALAGRLRLLLNVPYLLLVLGFVVFDAFEAIRSGGTVHVPGGVGPGAWLGAAGALLGAQPVIRGPAADDDEHRRWLGSAQIIGYASMVGASLSTIFNTCWRVRYALHSGGSSDFGKQNIAVIATAVVYGSVALAAVLVASSWILRSTKASRLATTGLGMSTLAAGVLVWSLPIGRDVDAFHGIAQNTSTAGVGYEGYLAWAAAAAIFAPPTLFALYGHRGAAPDDQSPRRVAARKGLLLIAVWCLGSVLMRITDLVVAVSLNFPFSRYDTMTLAAFDLATAVLAIWLRINLANTSVSARLISSLCGLLVTMSISRVVVGIALAPRFQAPPGGGGWHNPIYGNNLAHQITSIFDVVLCWLALGILVAAVTTGHLTGRRLRRRAAHAAKRRVPAATVSPSAAPTTRIATGMPDTADNAGQVPTAVMPQLASSPRIFRGSPDQDSVTRQIHVEAPKIYRPPDDVN